jgi:hypothetical protein
MAIVGYHRYNWNHVGVVTSEIAGHEQFVQCVRETVASHSPRWRPGRPPPSARFVIQDVFKLTEARNYDVMDIVNSEVRIMLLYCTQVRRMQMRRRRQMRRRIRRERLP